MTQNTNDESQESAVDRCYQLSALLHLCESAALDVAHMEEAEEKIALSAGYISSAIEIAIGLTDEIHSALEGGVASS